MATMRVMVLRPTKAAAWVHQWEDAVQGVTGQVMDPLPLLPGSTAPTPSLPWSWCTDWIPWRWTPTGSSTSSVCTATWSGWVLPASALLRPMKFFEKTSMRWRSVQFSIFSSVMSNRSSSWRVSQELRWWKWETATLWTAPSLTWTTPSSLRKEWTSGELFFFSPPDSKTRSMSAILNLGCRLLLQCVQAASNRTRPMLWTRRRHKQFQRLPRFQEQPVHLPRAGSKEPHSASEQRAALLQCPARCHSRDFLSGPCTEKSGMNSCFYMGGRWSLKSSFALQFLTNVVSFTDLWGDWCQVPHQC